MSDTLSGAEKRTLKARAQLLEPLVRLGRDGASEAFYGALEAALDRHHLVKVRFAGLKEAKKQLAPAIAKQTGSALIMRVGNVAVYYRMAALRGDSGGLGAGDGGREGETLPEP